MGEKSLHAGDRGHGVTPIIELSHWLGTDDL